MVQPRSILLVKTSAIGDVIQTFPALEYLRRKFPEAQIDWVAEEGIVPLLVAHPEVSNVIGIRTKSWRKAPFSAQTRAEFKAFVAKLRSTRYDILFDLQGNSKSAVVTGCAKAQAKVGFGWKSVREKSNLLVTTRRLDVPSDLNIRLKYLRLVQGYFQDETAFVAEGVRLQIRDEEQQRLVQIIGKTEPLRLMVCFGSKWKNKQMELSTLSAFLQKVAADCNPSFLLIYGDEEEKRSAEVLCSALGPRASAVGNLSLPLWQALMWEMDGIISVDSAALHLCGTTQTSTLSVFGPSSSSCYKPMEERHVSVQGSCPYGRQFVSRCPILRTCATGACIRDLDAERLFQTFKEWKGAHLKRAALP